MKQVLLPLAALLLFAPSAHAMQLSASAVEAAVKAAKQAAKVDADFCARDVFACFKSFNYAKALEKAGEQSGLDISEMQRMADQASQDLARAFTRPEAVVRSTFTGEDLQRTFAELISDSVRHLDPKITGAIILKLGKSTPAELEALAIEEIRGILRILELDQAATGSSLNMLQAETYSMVRNDLLQLAIAKEAVLGTPEGFRALELQIAESEILSDAFSANKIANLSNDGVVDLSSALTKLNLGQTDVTLREALLSRVEEIFREISPKVGKKISVSAYVKLLTSLDGSFFNRALIRSISYNHRSLQRDLVLQMARVLKRFPELLDDPAYMQFVENRGLSIEGMQKILQQYSYPRGRSRVRLDIRNVTL